MSIDIQLLQSTCCGPSLPFPIKLLPEEYRKPLIMSDIENIAQKKIVESQDVSYEM